MSGIRHTRMRPLHGGLAHWRLALAIAGCAVVASCQTLTIQPPTAPNAMDTTMSSFSESQADRYIVVTMTDAVHQQLVQGERVDREAELPPLYARFLANLSRTYALKRVADWPLSSLDIRCLVFEVADAGSRDATVAALSREQYVESAQRLSMFGTSGTSEPPPAGSYDDPYRNLQYGFTSMQVGEAHRWATGKGVRVAVVDTGLDTHHPDLRSRVTGIRNFVDRDTGAFDGDVHGTAVAGVIAASSNNGVGLVGVAPEAELLGLKACWQSDPTSRTGKCSSFTLAKALNFAIEQGVDVINLSLGGPADPLLTRLVNEALKRNMLVVGAVTPAWPNGFPVGIEGVVAVSNLETQAAAQPSSADARSADVRRAVTAPGNQVLSAKPAGEYDFYSGSSFSTAQVAGVAALIRQRKPHLSSNVVRELIMTTADSAQNANACRAVARVVAEGGGGADCGTPAAAQTSGR
jgi:subtilisin family serine protease